jgi:hypothetical protein
MSDPLDPIFGTDVAVKEYDDKCKKLINNIQNDIDSLKDTKWRAGVLYQEDLNNLLLDFSKLMQTVRAIRSTKNPKDWIRDNPIFEYQARYENLHKLVKQGELGKKTFFDILFESISVNMLIVLIIILCIVWLYVRSDLYNHKNSGSGVPKPSEQYNKST